MKRISTFFLAGFMGILLFSITVSGQNVKYTSPVNNSSFNMEQTSIIIAFEQPQNILKLKVLGSESGYQIWQ